MKLLNKKKKKSQAEKDKPNDASPTQQNHQATLGNITNGAEFDAVPLPSKPFRYGTHVSKTKINIGGLPIDVFGLEELTPASARASAPEPPEVCIAIHMHGRGGSAENEERIVRHLWEGIQRHSQNHRHQKTGHIQRKALGSSPAMREFVIASFDARNHGHRLTSQQGQKDWKRGNDKHALDLYAMIVGNAQDASLLIDFLPSYLFPYDERKVTQFAITGKSLGGHTAWHVLANDNRVTVGVPFISCPNYAALMAQRARKSFVNNGPPHIPASLSRLIASIDPASRSYDVADPHQNPFWGKAILMCNGEMDKLVPGRCHEDFVQRLVVGPPDVHRHNFRHLLLPGVGHEVPEAMVEEAAFWIFLHAIRLPQ